MWRARRLALALMLTLRPAEAASSEPLLLAVRAEPATVVRPKLLSQTAVAAIVRRVGGEASDELCVVLKQASGGNPFYLRELLRGVELEGRPLNELDPGELVARGGESLAQQVASRIRHIDPQALRFAQALAVLGDGCELRHAGGSRH